MVIADSIWAQINRKRSDFFEPSPVQRSVGNSGLSRRLISDALPHALRMLLHVLASAPLKAREKPKPAI